MKASDAPYLQGQYGWSAGGAEYRAEFDAAAYNLFRCEILQANRFSNFVTLVANFGGCQLAQSNWLCGRFEIDISLFNGLSSPPSRKMLMVSGASSSISSV
jgi:hypothetical protein